MDFIELYDKISKDIKKTKEFTSNAVNKDKRVYKVYNSNIKTPNTYFAYLQDVVNYPNKDHHQKFEVLRNLNLLPDGTNEEAEGRSRLALKLYSKLKNSKNDNDYILSFLLFVFMINSNYPLSKGSIFVMDNLPENIFNKYDEYLKKIINGENTITNPVIALFVFYSNKELLKKYIEFIQDYNENKKELLENIQEKDGSIVKKRIADCQIGSFKNEALLASYYFEWDMLDIESISSYDELITKIIKKFQEKILYNNNTNIKKSWNHLKTLLLNLTKEEKMVFIKTLGLSTVDFKEFVRKQTIIVKNEGLKGMEKYVPTKVRLNQHKFRKSLLEDKIHKGCRVCQCNINKEDFLIASHIVPWSESSDIEKLDKNNGLLLCAMHDLLFDRNLISFDENGKMIISNEIDELEYEFLNISKNHYIKVDDENVKYLKIHREKLK